MADYAVPKSGVAYIMYVELPSQANPLVFQTNPTIAAGDFKVSIDGGAFANLATLPVVTPSGGKSVKIALSSGEMTGDNIKVVASDAAGAEWCDQSWGIQTAPRGIADLAFPVVSGRGIAVDSSNRVDLGAWLGSTPNVLISGRVDANVQATASALTFNLTGTVSGSVGSVTGAVGSVTGNIGGTLTSSERNAIADALLNRDIAVARGLTASSRTVVEALDALRNKWSISGSTITYCKPDDSTTSWTSALGATAGADPVTSSDPT